MKRGVTFFDTTANQSIKVLQLRDMTVSGEVDMASSLIE
jgi:hypothetical protein